VLPLLKVRPATGWWFPGKQLPDAHASFRLSPGGNSRPAYVRLDPTCGCAKRNSPGVDLPRPLGQGTGEHSPPLPRPTILDFIGLAQLVIIIKLSAVKGLHGDSRSTHATCQPRRRSAGARRVDGPDDRGTQDRNGDASPQAGLMQEPRLPDRQGPPRTIQAGLADELTTMHLHCRGTEVNLRQRYRA
jgi:hypothetical protein